MNGIAEIIESGKAPGIHTGAPDPTSADVAVPKAIKAVFDISYRHASKVPIRNEQVFKAIGYDEKTLRRTWKNL